MRDSVLVLDNGAALIADPEITVVRMRDGGYHCGNWESDDYHRKAGIKWSMPLPKWCREGIDSNHYVYATDLEIRKTEWGREYPVVHGRIVPVITKVVTEPRKRYAGGCTSLVLKEITYRVVSCAGVELERTEIGERDLRTLWSIPEQFQRDYLRKTNSTLLHETREIEKAHEDYSIVSIDGVEMLRAEWENREKTIRTYRRPIIECMGNVYRADRIIDHMYRIEGWKEENDVEEKSIDWSRVEERIVEKIFRKKSPIYRLHERAGESNDGYRMEYDEWAYYYEYYDVVTESGAHYYATKRIDVK